MFWTKLYMRYWQRRLPIKGWKVEKEPYSMFSVGDRWRWTVTLNDETSYRGSRYQYSAQACAEQMVGEVKRICKRARADRKPQSFGRGEVPPRG